MGILNWKRVARLILHEVVGLGLVRSRQQGKLRILCYHRFPAEPRAVAELEWQCAHLRRYYHPLSLAEAVESLRLGRPWPKGAVVVTIDDGYRDIATVAAPVFKRYGIVPTVYLIGGFIEGGEWPWWNVVEYCVRRTARKQWSYEAQGKVWDCSGVETGGAVEGICEELKQLPDQKRREAIASLPADLGVILPERAMGEYEPLSWNEIAQLRRQGFGFGAHTMTHPVLSRVESVERIEQEILDSRKLIEQRCGEEASDFCYPNGDFDERSQAAVARAGFRSTVTCEVGMNAPGASDVLRLRRLMTGTIDEQRFLFAEKLAGLRVA